LPRPEKRGEDKRFLGRKRDEIYSLVVVGEGDKKERDKDERKETV
jgi:hypothetical protein